MTMPISVLGCAGLCWEDFMNPAHCNASVIAGFSRACWVCWVLPRACACVMFSSRSFSSVKKLYARTEKPNKPNTLNTTIRNQLIFKAFDCDGFVLGLAVLCWVGIFNQENRND